LASRAILQSLLRRFDSDKRERVFLKIHISESRPLNRIPASGRLANECRVAGLHDGVDDFQAFVKVGEGTLYGIHREPLKVVKRPAECIGALGELTRH